MKRILLCAPALLLLLASCGHSEKPNTISTELSHYSDSVRAADSIAKNAPPIDVNFTTAKDKANDGKRVTIEGYIALPSSSMISDDNVQLDFKERPNEFGTALNFIVDMKVGKGSNTMLKIPLKYKEEDVKITGNGGEAIVIGDHVRLTGRLSVSDSYCSIDCEKIEKIDPVKTDYKKLVTEQLAGKDMGDAAHEDHLVYADGTLDTPMMTMGDDYTFMYLDLDGSREARITVNFAYGETPGHLERLPDHYSNKDWKIHTDENQMVNMKKRVRVYGIWQKGALYAESIENI